MSLLKRLFGGGDTAAPSHDHNGYSITPTPVAENGAYRISARIEKDGKTHILIRADTISDQETAMEASVEKARQVIDALGDDIFR